MPSVPGITAAGSSRVILSLRKKAGRLPDLYARDWDNQPLKDDEFVMSADEKTTIQARRRKHATHACGPRTPMRRARILSLWRLDLPGRT